MTRNIAVWHSRNHGEPPMPPLAIFSWQEAKEWFARKGVSFEETVLLDLQMEGLCTRIVGYRVEWEPANGFLEKR